jgi:hypothetical protein
LQVGEISQPVETDSGVHIILRTEWVMSKSLKYEYLLYFCTYNCIKFGILLTINWILINNMNIIISCKVL